MLKCLYVALGGAVGSVLRYLIGLIKLSNPSGFPVKTLIINVLGAFIIGLVVSFSEVKGNVNPGLILFLKVGICGGFTTFSTFALESGDLLQNGKTMLAGLYIVLSVTLSVAAVFAARAIIK